MRSLTDIEIFNIWLVVDIVVTVGTAFFARRYFDKNGNGTTDNDELPKLSANIKAPVGEDAGLYDFILASVGPFNLEAFMYATAYGGITVLTCNKVFPGLSSLRSEVGWLLTIYAVFFSDLFLCAFSTNAVHVVTSHMTHFVYYGCGFIPVALYAGPPLPNAWLVPLYIILRLGIHTCFKFYTRPNYPSAWNIVPMYKLSKETGQWEVGSQPGDADDRPAPLCEFFWKWAVPFPAFEMLNVLWASHLTMGGVIAAIASSVMASQELDQHHAIWVSLLGALGFSVPYVNSRLTHVQLRMRGLSHFWPRSGAVLCAVVGAGMVAVPWSHDPGHPEAADLSETAAIALLLVEHGAHAVGLGLFAWSFFATAKHIGFGRACLRLSIFSSAGQRPAATVDKGIQIDNGSPAPPAAI